MHALPIVFHWVHQLSVLYPVLALGFQQQLFDQPNTVCLTWEQNFNVFIYGAFPWQCRAQGGLQFFLNKKQKPHIKPI